MLHITQNDSDLQEKVIRNVVLKAENTQFFDKKVYSTYNKTYILYLQKNMSVENIKNNEQAETKKDISKEVTTYTPKKIFLDQNQIYTSH
jgi:hypothetical protein